MTRYTITEYATRPGDGVDAGGVSPSFPPLASENVARDAEWFEPEPQGKWSDGWWIVPVGILSLIFWVALIWWAVGEYWM